MSACGQAVFSFLSFFSCAISGQELAAYSAILVLVFPACFFFSQHGRAWLPRCAADVVGLPCLVGSATICAQDACDEGRTRARGSLAGYVVSLSSRLMQCTTARQSPPFKKIHTCLTKPAMLHPPKLPKSVDIFACDSRLISLLSCQTSDWQPWAIGTTSGCLGPPPS